MGESRRYSLNARFDVEQILLEAQHRWLRPVEICEILRNYGNYRLTKEPPNRPPSGSLFLFDRKVVRYFRNDGHNWRKKKDGKTVKEAHERLKAGSVDVLHCYYAHGEEQEDFRRRSYWLLEEELSHIVFVHYLEVKGNKTTFFTSRNSVSSLSEDGYNNYEVVSSSTSPLQPRYQKGSSQVTDTTIFNGTSTSEWEDAESEYRNYSSPRIHNNVDKQPLVNIRVGPVPYSPVLMSNRNYRGPFSATSCLNFKSPTHGNIHETRENGMSHEPQRNHESQICQNPVQRSSAGYLSDISVKIPPTQLNAVTNIHGHGNEMLDHVVSGITKKITRATVHANILGEWQVADHHVQWSEDENSDRVINSFPVDHSSFGKPSFNNVSSELKAANELDLDELIGLINPCVIERRSKPVQLEFELPNLVAEGGSQKSCSENIETVEIGKNYPASRKTLLKGIQEGLQKVDSFDRWMSKELDDVAEPTSHGSSEAYWDSVGEENDDSGIPVQVPVEQLFSIIDFSPNWAYTDSDVKVLVMGRFLRSSEEVKRHKWACMFGEHEVPAEIISDGVLRCHTPLHASGRVPFYITCSNRLACSEVREFEFRPNAGDAGRAHFDETSLHMRFGKLLSLGSSNLSTHVKNCTLEISHLCSKISALLQDDKEWEQMLNLHNQDEQCGKDQLLQKLLKEKLHSWLLQKISEGGNGASVLDEGGQGVIHFASALGYQWAIPPTIAAGVCVDFRDVNGWTALHWAAYYGRERMIALLISLGADPGKVTDPTAQSPGRTPADLASSNGHKGIAGYLAESALSSHVSLLELDSDRSSKTRETASKWLVAPVSDGYVARGSLKESLAAVHNATQAAARIHQVYRIQSFQRKQLWEYGDTEYSDRAFSLLALKTKKTGQNAEPVHAAATRIQNKFRGWKGRKDFLLTRQRIIKIQAVVRGHQVRKRYRKIIWSVRFLDRVILRWRRKGRGLSVFKPSNYETEDDFDFLKDGKRQSEERLQKALARVKSMVRYPEARDQYGRLLNAVSEMQGMKAAYDQILHNQETDLHDDMIRLDALLEDDTFMQV